MPTVEADVAFGLGKFDLSLDEVRSRVSNALKSVGMADYSQVGILKLPHSFPSRYFSLFRLQSQAACTTHHVLQSYGQDRE